MPKILIISNLTNQQGRKPYIFWKIEFPQNFDLTKIFNY